MRVKRTLVFLVLILVAVAATGYLGLRVWLWFLGFDEPPPDDRGLLVERQEIPASENAFPLFVRAGELLAEIEKEPVRLPQAEAEDPPATRREAQTEKGLRVGDVLEAVRFDEPFDLETVGAALERCHEPLALFDEGLNRGKLKVPFPEGLEVPETAYMGHFIAVARTARVEARFYRARGQPHRAIERAVDLMCFGRLLQHAGPDLPVWRSGTVLEGLYGLHALREAMCASEVSPKRLEMAATQLAEMPGTQTALASALRQEYLFQSRLIEALRSGRIDPKTLQRRKQDGRRPAAWTYRPNETRRLLAERFRTLIANTDRPLVAMHWPEPLIESRANPLLTALKGNAIGRTLVGLCTPPVEYVLKVKCNIVTELRATRVMVALRRYQLEKGRLPADLEELVPAYLDAVLADDLGGEPFQYDPQERILYSVGKDQEDDGGMTREEIAAWCEEKGVSPSGLGDEPPFWDLPDPSWPIEF